MRRAQLGQTMSRSGAYRACLLYASKQTQPQTTQQVHS